MDNYLVYDVYNSFWRGENEIINQNSKDNGKMFPKKNNRKELDLEKRVDNINIRESRFEIPTEINPSLICNGEINYLEDIFKVKVKGPEISRIEYLIKLIIGSAISFFSVIFFILSSTGVVNVKPVIAFLVMIIAFGSWLTVFINEEIDKLKNGNS